MPQRRRRSAAITLVLAGTISGCGEPVPQRDVYQSLADCQRDWGNPRQCEPVRDNRYAPSYYYGPHYYGSSFPDGRPRASRSAMDAVRVASSSGARSGASSIARGGFGSSFRSSGS
jgi:uncharacterized protein YgiB involved in biofilm formation